MITSIPDNIINNTTSTDISILNNHYTIAPPLQQDIHNTPTVAQFLDASNASYAIIGKVGCLKPFEVDGKPLALQDIFSGMAAKV